MNKRFLLNCMACTFFVLPFKAYGTSAIYQMDSDSDEKVHRTVKTELGSNLNKKTADIDFDNFSQPQNDKKKLSIQGKTVDELIIGSKNSIGFFQTLGKNYGGYVGAAAFGYGAYVFGHWTGREAFQLVNDYLGIHPNGTWKQKVVFNSLKEEAGNIASTTLPAIALFVGNSAGSVLGEGMGFVIDKTIEGTQFLAKNSAKLAFRGAKSTLEDGLIPASYAVARGIKSAAMTSASAVSYAITEGIVPASTTVARGLQNAASYVTGKISSWWNRSA